MKFMVDPVRHRVNREHRVSKVARQSVEKPTGVVPEVQRSCPLAVRLNKSTLRELLFDVIATAYERNSLMVTTNLPFENWTEVLGSERLTGAALDRLTHRCHILETKGESYRLQDAKRRRRRTG